MPKALDKLKKECKYIRDQDVEPTRKKVLSNRKKYYRLFLKEYKDLYRVIDQYFKNVEYNYKYFSKIDKSYEHDIHDRWFLEEYGLEAGRFENKYRMINNSYEKLAMLLTYVSP